MNNEPKEWENEFNRYYEIIDLAEKAPVPRIALHQAFECLVAEAKKRAREEMVRDLLLNVVTIDVTPTIESQVEYYRALGHEEGQLQARKEIKSYASSHNISLTNQSKND